MKNSFNILHFFKLVYGNLHYFCRLLKAVRRMIRMARRNIAKTSKSSEKEELRDDKKPN